MTQFWPTPLAYVPHPLAADPVFEQIMQHGAVYCIGERRGGRVKVGWSRDPTLRLVQLQTGNDRRLRLLGWFPGTREIEAGIHADNADLHVLGEWFDDTDGLITHTFDKMLEGFKRGEFAL